VLRQGAARPRTAGMGRPVNQDAHGAGRQEMSKEEEEGEDEEFVTPKQRMEEVRKRIESLGGESDYEELIKAWVEYGACVRMEHGDKDRLLVRTHFNLATTYLRQKLVIQALGHFQEADLVNKANSAAEDFNFYRCRVLEGMGICETRLGHFKAAESLLDEACRLCMKKAMGPDVGDDAVEQAIKDMEFENVTDQDGAVAGVLVAKSELFSAQSDFDNAIKCLTDAYLLKEQVLGSDHKQIGKLYSALGTICRKQMHHKHELLRDVQATLASAIRVRQVCVSACPSGCVTLACAIRVRQLCVCVCVCV
jgi:tetratricopeptide (TPR) repeat protein